MVMAFTTTAEFTPGMDSFTGKFNEKSRFLNIVDAIKQAFEENDVSYRLQMKEMGEKRYFALFMHHVDGPFKASLTISGASARTVSEAVVHEIKGDNWTKLTPIAKKVLAQFGGRFIVKRFQDNEVKVDETVERTDFSYRESAFVKAARDISGFAELQQVPGLVSLISKEANRAALVDAIQNHGDALSEESEPSRTPGFG
jgi:hypothetical protein